MLNFERERQNMISGQLLPHKIVSPIILNKMGSVPREKFVPASLAHKCYVDETLETPSGRYLLAPMIFGRMLQALPLDPLNKVLNIGAGWGYSSFVLSALVGKVISLESDESQDAVLKENWCKEAAENIHPVYGDLEKGWPTEAPFEAIFIQGTVQEIPPSLLEQVKLGGYLICLIKESSLKIGRACLMTKGKTVWIQRDLFEAMTPYLKEFMKPSRFSL